MSQLPDQLRAAYREATDAVPPAAIRDLELTPGRKARTARPGRRRRQPDDSRRLSRVLIPLAAAVSVAAIAVAAVVIIPRLDGNTAGPHPRIAFSASPKFIVVNHLDANGRSASSLLTVVTAATGHVDARLNAPAGQAFDVVAGTPGGRTFFVAAEGASAPRKTFFYKFSVSTDGQPSALTPIPVRGVPPHSQALALTATADGSRLAVSLDGDGEDSGHGLNRVTGEIAIIDVASGTMIRHWTHTLTEDYSSDLSMSADGTLIGFTDYLRNGTQVSRVMATSAPSGPDTHASRIVVRNASAAMLDTSGTVLYALARSPSHQRFGSGRILVAYDVASGKQIKALHVWPAKTTLGTPVPDPAGRFALVPVLIGTKNRTEPVRINLATGALTRLPVSYPEISPFGVFAW